MESNERARAAIAAYLGREFGDESGEIGDDLHRVSIAYTTDGDGEHEFQWYADLTAMEIRLEIDGEPTDYREPLDIDYFENGDDVFDYYVGVAEDVLREREETER